MEEWHELCAVGPFDHFPHQYKGSPARSEKSQDTLQLQSEVSVQVVLDEEG